MAELIITTGRAATGKTTWAIDWVNEDPQTRRKTGDLVQARVWLSQGFDVVLDSEHITGFDVSLKKF